MSAAIAVRGLEKSYGKVAVLRGVDLAVERGTVLALLGSNGAGKTTAIRILATLLRADAGTALVDGLDVAEHPADVRAAISLTGQSAAVDERLSGRENLVLIAPPARARPGGDRGRPAHGLRACRGGRPEGRGVLGRHASTTRHRDEPDR